MRTSAAGSSRPNASDKPVAGKPAKAAPASGFTLLEMLVVVAIVAIASAGVSFAIRDSGATQLEREANRLAALLEAGRARSRSSGVAVRWQATENGFRFDGVAQGDLPAHWLADTTRVRNNSVLLLGPEPIIGRQAVVLESSALPGRRLRVATDGLRPFAVTPGDGS